VTVQTYETIIRDFSIDGIDVKFADWRHPAQGEIVFDIGMFNFIKSFIHRGDVVVDVGPHVGVETLLYGLAAGPTGTVYAFEPNPYVFAPLKKTCELNRQTTNIVPLNLAVTQNNGPCVFHYSDEGYCNGGFASETDAGVGAAGHRIPIEVEGVNLFGWFEKNAREHMTKIKFLKTDTEGYDLKVLVSSLGLIHMSNPIIQSELFTFLSRTEVENQLKFFDLHRYQTYFMPDQKQSALGSCNIYNLKDKSFTASDIDLAMRVCRGGNIFSVPKELLW